MKTENYNGHNKTKIGIFGLGTVGSGVVRYLQDFYNPEKTGLEIEVEKICVKNPNKKRDIEIDPKLLTSNPDDILENPNIDTIVELIGGIEPAGVYILRALERGKNVVTANKALLSLPYEKRGVCSHEEFESYEKQGKWPLGVGGGLLFISALTSKRHIGFEASVCGEIPIINAVSNMPSKADIAKLEGIINGTCNYILTKMEKGMNYGQALREAQKKGFAEQNPEFDVNGNDAAQKLAILSTIIFGHRIEVPDITCESIAEVTEEDAKYAKEWGYKIKQISLAKRYEGGDNEILELRVCPTLVPKNNLLAGIDNEDNAISLYFSDRIEPLTLVGKGAGMMPTARSVVQDIVEVNISNHRSRYYLYNLFTDFSWKNGDKGQFKSASYLRASVSDEPGVLGKISTLLGEYKVNINSVVQREEDKRNGTIPLTMLLNPTTEENMNKVLEELKKIECVKDVLRMRIQN